MADVGEDRLVVHDEHREDPSLAFALSRLAPGPDHADARSGSSGTCERPDYGTLVNQQLVAAAERRGPGDLAALLDVRVDLDRDLRSERRRY